MADNTTTNLITLLIPCTEGNSQLTDRHACNLQLAGGAACAVLQTSRRALGVEHMCTELATAGSTEVRQMQQVPFSVSVTQLQLQLQ